MKGMNTKIPEYMVNAHKAIDSLDAKAFGEFLTEDGTFTFGNMPPVVGRQNVVNFCTGFF